MAKTSNIVTEWGQAANTSNSGYGAGANNTIGWGSVHANSSGHDRTDLVGVPSVYVGNSETVDGSGDPTGGTAQLFYRNRIEARPLWDTRQNLLTYSEDFSNADWSKNNTTFSVDTLTASAGTAVKSLSQSNTTNGTQTFYFDVEYIDYQWFQLLVGTTGSDTGYANFDVLNNVLGNSSGVDNAFISVENGRTRIGITITTTNKTAVFLAFTNSASSSRAASTSSTGSVKVYQAQLNEGDTADEYVKTEANPYSFKGDETQLNDYSASNNGGQIYSGGALSFDGVNDDVTAPLGLGNLSEFTVTFLAKKDAISTQEYFVAASSVTNERWNIESTASDKIAVFSNSAGGTLTGNVSLNASDYFLISFTQSATKRAIYVNGVLDVEESANGSYDFSTILLGDSYVGARLLDGSISDFKLYTNVLTASEVLQNYNNPQQPIIDGLEVWYDFNELNGGTLFDRSGNGYNATINGATWVSGIKEGFQPALSGFNNYQTFDGSDDYVSNCGNPFDGGAFTLNTKLQSNNWASRTIVDQRDSLSDGLFIGTTALSEISFRINANTATSSYIPPTAEIVELSFVYDGIDTLEIYENEVLQDSVTVATSAVSTTSEMYIGRLSYTNAARFLGIIDYVEVEGVGRWSNLGGWVDEIGSNDGTVNGSPSTARIFGQTFSATTDVFGNTIQNAYIANALNFSGGYNGLYVDAGANVDTSGAFSFAGWVYITEETVSGSRVFENIDLSSTSGMRLFYSTVSGDGEFRADFDSGATSQQAVSGISEFSPTGWYFLVLTKSSSGEANFYKATKTTSPAISGSANQAVQSSTPASSNMLLANRTSGAANLDGYLIYPLMYTEDLSSANTDLAPIEQIWDATKSLIPS